MSDLKVQVYLSNGTKAKQINVTKTTKIIEALIKVNQHTNDIVVFTGPPENDNPTPIINLHSTFEDLNMYFDDKYYIAEICAFEILDVSKYNVELHSQYIDMYRD
jgi:hypothetical protein